MDLMRPLSLLFLFLLTVVTYAGSFDEYTGIVFIHGTNDHRQDAEEKYWKRSFINPIADALPNPDNVLVVACDFSQYMWDEGASGCVANQVLDFVNTKKINTLILYTHSNGANVIRWILSHPTYDARFMALFNKIHQVIAISPSSTGTVLADEVIDGHGFESAVAWLLGYRNNSVKQQRLADIALFNGEMLLGTEGRPSLPVPFKVIVGTDVTASPMNKASYCNGYLLNAGLKLTKLYLDDCSDGFLNCHSQVAVGDVWFRDFEKTENGLTLSHNQSRHNCFNLEKILHDDLLEEGA